MQDLKCQKEKSESEKKDFLNKLKMLKEENNDLRNRNNQLHQTLKIKINDLQEAEECIQWVKEKSKQVFQKEHNDYTYTSQSQRTDEKNKNGFKANHTCPTNHMSSNNHTDLIDVNQLITGSSSANNSRTTSAQAETSTFFIPNCRIIGRRETK